MYPEWLKKGLSKKGKSGRELASLLDKSESAVSRMASGKSKIKAIELPIIANYIGEQIPKGDCPAVDMQGFATQEIHASLVGSVSLHTWSEPARQYNAEPIPARTCEQYRHLSQYALVLDDDIAGYTTGSYVVWVNFSEVRAKPQPGDLLIVKKTSQSLCQYRLVKARRNGAGSSIFDYGTERGCDEMENEVIGLAIAIYNFL